MMLVIVALMATPGVISPPPPLEDLEQGVIEDARRRQRRRRVLATRVVLTAALVGLLGYFGSGGGTGNSRSSRSQTGRARPAARFASPPMRSGQYWYTRWIESARMAQAIVARGVRPVLAANGGPLAWFVVRLRFESWVGLDGTMRQRTIELSARFASAADRSRWHGAKLPFPTLVTGGDSLTLGDGQFPPQISGSAEDPGDALFSYHELLALPTVASALRNRLADAQKALWARERSPLPAYDRTPRAMDVIYDQLVSIGDLLASPIPLRLRIALFRVAPTLPTVRVIRGARDPVGRRGVAVSIGRDPRSRLVFNARTGKLLGDFNGAIVAQGVVNSITGLPKGVAAFPGPTTLTPEMIRIAPAVGGARTVFTVELPAPPRASRFGRAPRIQSFLFGPTGPGCRFSATTVPYGRARLSQGPVTSHAGHVFYSYRVSPPTANGGIWCAARYQLQLTPYPPSANDGVAVYFDVR
jgi:hypothetical protein